MARRTRRRGDIGLSRRSRTVIALVGIGLATAACVPEGVTDRGRQVSELYTWFMVAAAGVFVLVVGLLSWSIVRYRGQPGRDVIVPNPSRGNIPLEVAWWAAPTALVIVLVVLTAGVLSQVDARAARPAVTVQVQGFQWGWRFAFPDAGVEVTGTPANPARIDLPVGESIAFEITSRDVVHSFWIPAFLIKRDAVPGHPNRFDVTIEETGTYSGQCAEFCGLLHSRQLFEITAVQPDQFQAWLDEQAATTGEAP
ncbi:MAG TPA: cytochrome c oxidase subunit II [Candidatus Limnocylindria bacterium]|nr:cytochrome c oxidase subunit II [Candidatus Limnocylindria bacterium]